MATTKADSEHEAKCKRCGRCCYQKVIYKNKIYYTPYPCPYLDVRTRLCTVYEHRHSVNPYCLSVEEGLKLGVFPADCPYTKDVPNYKPPVMHVLNKELIELIMAGKVEDF